MKRIFAVAAILCAVTTLLGCFSKKPTDNTTTYQLTTIVYVQTSTDAMPTDNQAVDVQPTQGAQDNTQAITETISDTVPPIVPDTVPAPDPQESTTLGKTGEMAFSDDPSNRYISAVATKYGVDSKRLVALYTVPENDANIVLEFDGTTDGNGKLIRNESTLVAIYSIDKALNSKRASKDSSKNEYPYGEMMVMFISTTKYIMPEFEGQL
ncbi:MAG: hypothetical protein IKV44_01980 [Clostridia bacterium]|nr:hypothetical protein [Clostridia bacterium]